MSLIASIRKTIAKVYGGEHLIRYLRRKGMKIGERCRIFCDISTSESYLIEIGDDTTISGNVTFLTHDASIQKVLPNVTDLFGAIKIGSNCFIGYGTIIMYGVSIPDNTIIAAGSVVTSSIDNCGKIIGGNPARIIGDVDTYAEKYNANAVSIRGLSNEEKRKMLEKETLLVIK